MYTVYAINHTKTEEFTETYLERKLAYQTFDALRNCVDCAKVIITNGLTGEVLLEGDSLTITVHGTEDDWFDLIIDYM